MVVRPLLSSSIKNILSFSGWCITLGQSGGYTIFDFMCICEASAFLVYTLLSDLLSYETEDDLEANSNCKDLTWQKCEEFLSGDIKKKTRVMGLREEGEKVRFIEIPAIIRTETADFFQALGSRQRLLLLYRQLHFLWASIIVLWPCYLNQKTNRFDPRSALAESQAVYDLMIILGVLCRSFERQITTSKAARFHHMLST